MSEAEAQNRLHALIAEAVAESPTKSADEITLLLLTDYRQRMDPEVRNLLYKAGIEWCVEEVLK